MNRATLTGNLGADPEMKTMGNGKPVCNLRIATKDSWRDKQTGERKEATEWHRVVIFNEGLCGVAEQYLRKGSKVLIEGKIKTRKWTDQSGAEKYSTEIVLENFGGTLEMLGDKGGGGRSRDDDDGFGGSDNTPSRSSSRSTSTGSAPRRSSDMDDDIPFGPEFR